MSWQKCMPFSKCSNLETKNVIHFRLCHKKMKGRTIISDKPNLEINPFYIGYMHLKIKIKQQFKLKTKFSKAKS